MNYARSCHCLGRPIREGSHCITCGRDTVNPTQLTREDRRDEDRAGIAVLLEAVHRKRRELERATRPPAPRHRHRRVVIEPAPKAHRAVGRPPKSDAVRALEFATRMF